MRRDSAQDLPQYYSNLQVAGDEWAESRDYKAWVVYIAHMLSSITKRASRFLLRASCYSYTTSHAVEHQSTPSEDPTNTFVQRQILRAGLHYLKGDTEALKENVRKRRCSVDIDELVRSAWSLCDCLAY